MHERPDVGALVISLDFELHWGVRDHEPVDGPYRRNLLGVWRAVPLILETFEAFEVSATWATVGLLFARSREEQLSLAPSLRPTYADPRLDAYQEPVGLGPDDDPLHFAPALIERIRARPGQEIGTHTFSHYYCLEPGQTREQFAADLAAAVAIGEANGLPPRSLAFPRNQIDPAYDDIVRSAGITCYRGNQPSWMYRSGPKGSMTYRRRAGRLLHEYAGPGSINLTGWQDIYQDSGLCNVPASLFVRGYSPRRRHLDEMRLGRIKRALRDAAESRRIIHLWWHPHNFGAYPEESVRLLRVMLSEFDRLRGSHAMRSLSMADVATTLGARSA